MLLNSSRLRSYIASLLEAHDVLLMDEKVDESVRVSSHFEMPGVTAPAEQNGLNLILVDSNIMSLA